MRNKNKKKTFTLLVVWILLLITIPFVTKIMQDGLSSNNHSYISSEFDIEEYNVVLDVDDDYKSSVKDVLKDLGY